MEIQEITYSNGTVFVTVKKTAEVDGEVFEKFETFLFQDFKDESFEKKVYKLIEGNENAEQAVDK